MLLKQEALLVENEQLSIQKFAQSNVLGKRKSENELQDIVEPTPTKKQKIEDPNMINNPEQQKTTALTVMTPSVPEPVPQQEPQKKMT